MSIQGSQCGPASPGATFTKALYNPDGMRRFWSSLWMCAVGAGGVDVPIIGDSTSWGSGNGVNAFTQSWPSLLKVGLQKALNPASVPGGYGAIPLDYTFSNGVISALPNLATAGSTNWEVNSPYATTSGSPSTGGGTGLLMVHSNSANPAIYALFDFAGSNSTDPVLVKQAATSYRLHGLNQLWVDTYTKPAGTTPVTIGTGAFGHASDTPSGTSTWNKVTPVNTVNGGVSPSAAWRFQLYSDSGNNGHDMYASFIDLFRGDENAGIRIHNFGFAGSTAQEWAAATNTIANDANCAQSSYCKASADGTTTPATGANNARLFIIPLGLNDFALARTVAQYQTDIQTLVTACGAQNSRPSVLLVAQLPRFAAPYQACFQTWEQWISALKAVVDATPNYCALLDLWKMLQYGRPDTGLPQTLGIMNTDQVHQSVYGYQFVAQAVQNVCLMGPYGYG